MIAHPISKSRIDHGVTPPSLFSLWLLYVRQLFCPQVRFEPGEWLRFVDSSVLDDQTWNPERWVLVRLDVVTGKAVTDRCWATVLSRHLSGFQTLLKLSRRILILDKITLPT